MRIIQLLKRMMVLMKANPLTMTRMIKIFKQRKLTEHQEVKAQKKKREEESHDLKVHQEDSLKLRKMIAILKSILKK